LEENLNTIKDLQSMQAREFGDKVQTSIAKIMEALNRYDKKMYVSFSGGKDSTVLADLVAQVCKMFNCKLVLWYSDTGLEYPEVREHVKSYPDYLKNKYNIEVELIMDYPKDKDGKRLVFKDVVFKYGYPIVSKEISRDVCAAKNKPDGKTAQKFVRGSDYHKKYGDSWLLERWAYLLDSPFKISNQCCNIMKKQPAHRFNKESGLIPFIGTMASESQLRKKEWLQNGCNAFNNKNPSSRPLSFWKEDDILKYIRRYNLPYPKVYGEIIEDEKGKLKTTGCDRTGCMYCGFGCQTEKYPNRFQRLKETHPKIWEYCMKPVGEGGLGMK
jgi:3'-phosphoadenosine 5'-phosphosulfate sulfotransferase (PAPS reductase)/FAD synthetase